jgi:hypothetical protein
MHHHYHHHHRHHHNHHSVQKFILKNHIWMITINSFITSFRITPVMRQVFNLRENCGGIINNNRQLPLLHFISMFQSQCRIFLTSCSVLLMLYLECNVRAVIFTFIYIFKTVTSQTTKHIS